MCSCLRSSSHGCARSHLASIVRLERTSRGTRDVGLWQAPYSLPLAPITLVEGAFVLRHNSGQWRAPAASMCAQDAVLS